MITFTYEVVVTVADESAGSDVEKALEKAAREFDMQCSIIEINAEESADEEA